MTWCSCWSRLERGRNPEQTQATVSFPHLLIVQRLGSPFMVVQNSQSGQRGLIIKEFLVSSAADPTLPRDMS